MPTSGGMNAYQRLFAWFGSLATLGAMGFVTVWLYGIPLLGIEGVYSAEERRAIVALEALADHERESFERWLGYYRRELRILANNEGLLQTMMAARVDRGFIQRKLDYHQGMDSGGYQGLYVTDKRGVLLAGSDMALKEVPAAHSALLKKASEPGVLELIQVVHDGRPYLLVVQQLVALDQSGHPSGERLGSLVAQLALLAPLIAEKKHNFEEDLGHEGALLLFDSHGQVLANTSRYFPNDYYAHIGAEVTAGAEDVRLVPRPGEGETIAVIRHLHLGVSEGASLVLASQTDDVLAATRSVFWRIAALGSSILLLAMGLVYFAARQIARGEQEVHDLNASLEQRVIARTEELAHSNERLLQAMQALESTRDDLVRSEKLAALGALVAGIAHEMNTPLGNAVLVATTLQEAETRFNESKGSGLTRATLDAYLQEQKLGLELLSTNLNRAAALVTSFKQLAVDQASEQRRQFSVAEMLDEVLLVMSPALRRTPFTLSSEAPAGILMDSYPGPLEQVLVNFINNAMLHAFAGRDKGVMHIQASTVGADEVQIVFSDDGCGIGEDIIGRIFDPFFSTRLGRGGNGLGLHIAYNIVTTLLGGRIEVSSQLGSGTRFTLFLPLMAPNNRPRQAVQR